MTPARGGADLHVHTTHSDRSCSPGEVCRAAANVGLDALAITDHDTVSALAVAAPEALRLGVELVTGVELTTEHEGREYHLLGYFFRPDDPELGETCRDLRARREARLAGMIGRLGDLGLRVDREALRRAFPRATLGRRHLADWLALSGQVAGRREAFDRYLADDGPAQVPKPRLPIAEAIALVGRAGGVAALAHPPYDLRDTSLVAFAEAGLKAIEAAGPRGLGERLGRLVGRLDLLTVSGSDFHAPDRPGRWVGSRVTPRAGLDALRRLAP